MLGGFMSTELLYLYRLVQQLILKVMAFAIEKVCVIQWNSIIEWKILMMGSTRSNDEK